MLYVFDVISGKFLAYEKNISISLVSDLRFAIERHTGLSGANQILLASGGQVPLNENPVDAYDAGSEDNPFFLFARPASVSSSVDLGRSLTSPDELAPVAGGTHLLTTAEQLVHAQHLQHQGWQAAVGNLSDVTSSVRNAAETLRRRLATLQSDETRLSSVECISVEEDGAAVDDIVQRLQIAANLLKKLPLPSSLKRESLDNVCDLLALQVGMSCSAVIDELINTKDTLKDAFLSLEAFEKWAAEGDRTDMREISGLTDRLGRLDQFLNDARMKCAAGGVSTSPPRFTGASSPPTHYVSRSLNDVVTRCAAAAAELRNNLNQRVDWLSFVQSRLACCAAQFVITSANIRRRHKAIRNALIFVSAPPFYIKLALAQHSCNSTLFASCLPCPIHSHVSVSDSSTQQTFTHPLSNIFNAKSAVTQSHSTGSDQNQQTPAIFTTADLAAIREAVPSLFSDQQSKFKHCLGKLEGNVTADRTQELSELSQKLKSLISSDKAALADLRLSVKTNIDSSARFLQDCKEMFEKVLKDADKNASIASTEVSKPEMRDVGIATQDDNDNELVRPTSAPAGAPANAVSAPTEAPVAVPGAVVAVRESASSSSGRPQARLNIALSGISTGDLVIVTWSDELEQPVILTISPVPHLIHQDSIDALSYTVPQNPILSWLSSGDTIIGGVPQPVSANSNRPSWFQPPNHYRLAEVIEKQHCQVRRASNRYRLQVNTRFFRLRVRPVCVEPAMSSAISAPSLQGLNNVAEERRQSVDSEQVLAGTSP